MPKVEIELPTGELDAASRRRIAELEHKLDLAEKREKKLKDRVEQLMSDREFILVAKNQMEELVDEWVEHLDLWGKYDRA